jgi:hypothetical protein
MQRRFFVWAVCGAARYILGAPHKKGAQIGSVDLKSDLPSVPEALQRLERELTLARQDGAALLKVIHGYGSTGTGGDIRVAVQKRLRELREAGRIRGCIFGENWSKSDEETWRLVQTQAKLKNDHDLGRHNPGITIVLL